MTTLSAPYPAATVILCRHRAEQLEVLLLQRSDNLRFAPGAWVFPGGRIDPEDFGDHPGNLDIAARRAACREAWEETGFAISKESLLPCYHWTTPATQGRRFATWFFIALLEETSVCDGSTVKVDGSEIVKARWLTPSDALAAHQCGELPMMSPTFIALLELSGCEQFAEAATLFNNRPVRTHKPKLIRPTAPDQPQIVLLLEEDTGYVTADPNLEGTRHRTEHWQGCWRYICSQTAS